MAVPHYLALANRAVGREEFFESLLCHFIVQVCDLDLGPSGSQSLELLVRLDKWLFVTARHLILSLLV
jgi:hypothetical protein